MGRRRRVLERKRREAGQSRRRRGFLGWLHGVKHDGGLSKHVLYAALAFFSCFILVPIAALSGTRLGHAEYPIVKAGGMITGIVGAYWLLTLAASAATEAAARILPEVDAHDPAAVRASDAEDAAALKRLEHKLKQKGDHEGGLSLVTTAGNAGDLSLSQDAQGALSTADSADHDLTDGEQAGQS